MQNPTFVIFVADQERSKNFYRVILKTEPIINGAGWTMFSLSEAITLGIMLETKIASILGDSSPHPNQGNGIPRCELYLFVNNPEESLQKLLEAGGKEVCRTKQRPWGDHVAYGLDPDGHVIAFAKKKSK